MEALQSHRWPGNVRELENVIEAAVVLVRGDVIDVPDLSQEFRQKVTSRPPSIGPPASPLAQIDKRFSDAKQLAVQRFERSYVVAMLNATGGNISEAARRAGLDRSNFRRVMMKYQSDVETLIE